MPSGGHARSGPAPDPAALRRGAAGAAGWFQLSIPTNPPPPWPLLDDPSPRELSIWNDLWSRPAATAWPAFSLTREVAVYARCLAEFESPGKTNAALGNLVRSLADDLGLTIPGARRNEWLLPSPTPARASTSLPRTPRRTARDRIPRAQFTLNPDRETA